MGIKRIIDTDFWTDEKVIDLYSPEDKYFMLYLMTNPQTTQLGIYKLPKKLIAFELGYSLDSVEVLLDRFETKYENIIYNHEAQEIAILNSLKYSIVKGGKPVEDLLKRELSQVTDSTLIESVYQKMREWWKLSTRQFDSNIKNIFKEEIKKRNNTNNILNDNDNDNDNEESYHDSYHDSSKTTEKVDNSTKKKYKGIDRKNVLNVFKEYEKYRKEIKKPMSELAIKKAINKLNTICSNDQEKIECLEQSIINGWTGLFEVKKSNKQEKVKIKGSSLGNISDLYD